MAYVMGSVVETAPTPLDGFNTGFVICGVIMLVGGIIGGADASRAGNDPVDGRNAGGGSGARLKEAHTALDLVAFAVSPFEALGAETLRLVDQIMRWCPASGHQLPFAGRGRRKLVAKAKLSGVLVGIRVMNLR